VVSACVAWRSLHAWPDHEGYRHRPLAAAKKRAAIAAPSVLVVAPRPPVIGPKAIIPADPPAPISEPAPVAENDPAAMKTAPSEGAVPAEGSPASESPRCKRPAREATASKAVYAGESWPEPAHHAAPAKATHCEAVTTKSATEATEAAEASVTTAAETSMATAPTLAYQRESAIRVWGHRPIQGRHNRRSK